MRRRWGGWQAVICDINTTPPVLSSPHTLTVWLSDCLTVWHPGELHTPARPGSPYKPGCKQTKRTEIENYDASVLLRGNCQLEAVTRCGSWLFYYFSSDKKSSVWARSDCKMNQSLCKLEAPPGLVGPLQVYQSIGHWNTAVLVILSLHLLPVWALATTFLCRWNFLLISGLVGVGAWGSTSKILGALKRDRKLFIRSLLTLLLHGRNIDVISW